MFKKWCIWQAIGVAEGQEQQLKATELRTVDRFINKVLKVEGEKEERIKQLVESIQQMKHLSRNNYPRERLQETEGELANIYEGCSIVKKASIKNYIM